MTDTGSQSNASGTQSATDLMREQRLQRNLKILVGGLGALILLGLGAIMVKVSGLAPGKSSSAGSTSTVTSVATPGGEIALELPKGAKVVSVSLSGNRLAIHHESPTGTGIAVLDLETGRRIADVKPLEGVPRN
jgi:hypothetical protein